MITLYWMKDKYESQKCCIKLHLISQHAHTHCHFIYQIHKMFVCFILCKEKKVTKCHYIFYDAFKWYFLVYINYVCGAY